MTINVKIHLYIIYIYILYIISIYFSYYIWKLPSHIFDIMQITSMYCFWGKIFPDSVMKFPSIWMYKLFESRLFQSFIHNSLKEREIFSIFLKEYGVCFQTIPSSSIPALNPATTLNITFNFAWSFTLKMSFCLFFFLKCMPLEKKLLGRGKYIWWHFSFVFLRKVTLHANLFSKNLHDGKWGINYCFSAS